MSWTSTRMFSSKRDTLRALFRSTGLPRATIGRTVIWTAPSVSPRDCISPSCRVPSRWGDIEAVNLLVDALNGGEQAVMIGASVERGDHRRRASSYTFLDQEV